MLTIKIIPNDKGYPTGQLADVELHFGPLYTRQGSIGMAPAHISDTDCALDGLKLIGFSVWERTRTVDPVYAGGRSGVTTPQRYVEFPERRGERRSFPLLRPISDQNATTYIKDLILQAYAEYEATQ